MNDTSWADILPNDGKLCERTKKWRGVFQKYKRLDEDESLNILIDESLPFVLDEEAQQQQPYAESITISEFEDNAADEDDFDVEDVLNQTKQVIEKRKESWNQSGIGYMMDAFAFDNFSDKVDSWLQNNCDFFSSKFVRDSKRNCINGPTIGQKNIVVEKCFDELSDSSVDTAKYILSNRKRRKSKVTMTIKQFCYSAQNNGGDKQFRLKNIISRDYSERDSLTVDRKKIRLRSDDRSALVRKIDFSKRKDISRTTSYSSTSSSDDCVQKRLRKTTKKPQSSRKNGDLSDKLGSCNNRSNEISPQSVCKSKHYSKKRILRSLPMRSAELPIDPELPLEESKKKQKFNKQKHQSDLSSTSGSLSDEDKERSKPSFRELRKHEYRKSNKTRETHISPRKSTRQQHQSSRKSLYSSDKIESCDNRGNEVSPQNICKIKHNSKKQASRQFPIKSANLPFDHELSLKECNSDQLTDLSPKVKQKFNKGKSHCDLTSPSNSSSDENKRQSHPCFRVLRKHKHRKKIETREKHISPRKITKQQPHSSRNKVYSSDESESGNNRGNEISQSVCRSKSNTKRRTSSQLYMKSAVLPIDSELSLDESHSDQLTDVLSMKKQKTNKGRHPSDLTSSSDSISDGDKKRIRPSRRKLRQNEHRKSGETREKHIYPRKSTTQQPVEFICSPQKDCLDSTILYSPDKKLKNISEKHQSGESSSSNSFIEDTKKAHEELNKHLTSQNNVEPTRVSDRLKEAKRAQFEQRQQNMNSVSQNILVKARLPIAQRRHTESNFKPTNNTAASASELNLTHTGVINSTALKSQDSMIHCKETFENICHNIVEGVNSHQKSVQDNTITSCNSKDISGRNSSTGILLYSPNIKKLSKRLSETGKVIITENDLEDNLGPHLKNRFLGNQREFHYECHADSKLIFIPPAESHIREMTSESEEDAIDILARKEGGEIIEIMKLSDAKRE